MAKPPGSRPRAPGTALPEARGLEPGAPATLLVPAPPDLGGGHRGDRRTRVLRQSRTRSPRRANRSAAVCCSATCAIRRPSGRGHNAIAGRSALSRRLAGRTPPKDPIAPWVLKHLARFPTSRPIGFLYRMSLGVLPLPRTSSMLPGVSLEASQRRSAWRHMTKMTHRKAIHSPARTVWATTASARSSAIIAGHRGRPCLSPQSAEQTATVPRTYLPTRSE
jgi:hypothetical protein